MATVKSSLDKLSNKDTYSLLMFVLFKLKDVPTIAPLSQLVYLLDEENLIKLLKYFGGQTITFPTLDDLQETIFALSLYKKVVIDNIDYNISLKDIPSSVLNQVLSKYDDICKIMEDYSFVY